MDGSNGKEKTAYRNYRYFLASTAIALLLLILLQQALFSFAAPVIGVFFPGASEETMSFLQEVYNAIVYIIVFLIPALLIRVFVKMGAAKMPDAEKLYVRNGNYESLALWLLAGIALILVSSQINSVFVSIFRYSDFSEEYLWNVDLSSSYRIILYFVSSCLIPAVVEEFLFRGTILHGLIPYGKGLAVTVSAVLFGLMHTNVEQFLFATCSGIVLGYLYLKTKSIWAPMLLHFLNNLFSSLVMLLMKNCGSFGETAVILLELVVILSGIAALAYLLLRDKLRLESEGKTVISGYEAVRGFWNPWMIVYVIVCSVIMLLLIFAALQYAGGEVV